MFVFVHYGDCWGCITAIIETRVLFDAASKYGFGGKQIHNKVTNNCKIRNKTNDFCQNVLSIKS